VTLEELSSGPESISSRCYDEILTDLSDKGKKAFYVAREILTSERTFVDVLNLLTIDFPQALRTAWESAPTGQPIIASRDLEIILGGLPTLKEVNRILLKELEDRIGSWKTNPKVSDIIVKTGPFLKHYSTFIRDFGKISQHFDLVRHKNLKFSKVVADFEATERCRHLSLKHYMLKPVQRMPQYALLLTSYLKCLDEDSEDYEDTMKAITIVKEVAEHGDDAIRLQVRPHVPIFKGRVSNYVNNFRTYQESGKAKRNWPSNF
jgi:FYVE/RhoGEF/PH domain-containing protein 5/6